MAKKVYIVTNEGDVVYASKYAEDSESYADTKNYEARAAILEERGIDDPTDEDIAEAAFEAGYNGDFHKCEEVDLDNADDDGTLYLSDGAEVSVESIEACL